MGYPIVYGWCPVGCGSGRLELHGGRIQCSDPACPRPQAVHEILADPETEHVVTLTRTGFTIRHPLRERLDDQLMQCTLHAYLSRHPAPRPPGLYRVAGVPGALQWEELPS